MSARRRSLSLHICLASCLLSGAADLAQSAHEGQPGEAGREIDFAKHIRPIFASRCVECHGPNTQEAGLRLDHRTPALRGGDSGRVIVPGETGASELFRRISAQDPAERMPPDDGESKPLTAEQIELIRRWIAGGAAWPDDGTRLAVKSDHWAYQPVRKPAPPVSLTSVVPQGVPPARSLPRVAGGIDRWSRSPLDAFLLARLRQAGLKPSPAADRPTLLRRLCYDLLGLPPTPEEVNEFAADAAPDAVHKSLDRLLAAPHFGERWGRHWLDAARYADSDGYEKDNPRPDAWRYRDWVIDAINRDLPFDEFTRQQLAGDLLPGAGPLERLATAFHRQTLTNTEGGTDQEQFRVEAVFDRVNTTGTIWLGLTVGCAQCHSHKYDQISQAEYYQLFAFFNNGDETTAEVPISDWAVAKYERDQTAFDRAAAELDAKLSDRRDEISPGLPAWEDELRAQLAAAANDEVRFHPLEIVSVKSTGGATFRQLDDGSYLAGGDNPAAATYTIVARTELAGVTGLRLDVLADDTLPAQGPGRVAHGNFVLNEFVVHTSGDKKLDGKQRVTFANASADFSQDGWAVTGAIDDVPKSGWAVAPQFGKDHHAVFVAERPVNRDGRTTWLEIVLKQDYGTQHTLGRWRLQARTGSIPGETIPGTVREILAVQPAGRSPDQAAALLDYYASRDDEYRGLLQQRDALNREAPAPPVMTVRVVSQRTSDPRTTHILRRGDFLQPAEPVVPETLAVLPEFKPRSTAGRADRLDLANWLLDADNPLTPRVTVNHVWSHLFGRGLVSTQNDFGVRGEPPTHPDLLDWLAAEFRGQRPEARGPRSDAGDADDHSLLTTHHSPRNWSRKRLIRLIVASAAYQQASRHRADLEAVDPQNTLLGRQNRVRVEAEVVRDIYLAASGLLARKLGGPSVFPPMPPDVAALSYAGNFRWNDSLGLDRVRRGMYTFFKRTAPHPTLMTFDCPDANTTNVNRSSSNTPLMALATLNNIVFVEASQALACRVLETSGATDAERLTRAFRLCVARPPSAGELDQFHELLEASRDWYARHGDSAGELIGGYQPPGVAAPEAAAWVAVCRILMNMDEFIVRE